MKIRLGRKGFTVTFRKTSFPFGWARRQVGYMLIRGYYTRRGKPELADEVIATLNSAYNKRRRHPDFTIS